MTAKAIVAPWLVSVVKTNWIMMSAAGTAVTVKVAGAQLTFRVFIAINGFNGQAY